MITAFLNKPYPYFKNIRKDLLGYFLVGGFVAGFLIIFQPFEISEWITSNKNLKLWGFGLVSLLVPTMLSFVIQYLIPSRFVEESWTVLKEISVILLVLICIAFGNLFYGRLLGVMPMNIEAYLNAIIFTFLIGIFPVTFYVILKHNTFLKLNLQQTVELNKQLENHYQKMFVDSGNPTVPPKITPREQNDHRIQLIAENEKDVCEIVLSDLLFIESADNYSNIVFNENGKTKKQLLRSSLKRIENQLTSPDVMRCHRSFIVNLSKVKNFEGNAAGYKLFFHETNDFVPVSRNYISSITQRLKASK